KAWDHCCGGRAGRRGCRRSRCCSIWPTPPRPWITLAARSTTSTVTRFASSIVTSSRPICCCRAGRSRAADLDWAKRLRLWVPDLSYSMTPAYAPPEFFSGETAPTSDQYSLGITYYELRTSRLPFTGSPARIMHGHVNDEPDLTGLSEREREIVARALAKNPE